MRGEPERVLALADVGVAGLRRLSRRYGLSLLVGASGADIPGSYWGAPEAGLIGTELYARADTPLHSLLHESAHYVCMSRSRRSRLHTEAGGDDAEECAVCYLQVLLAEYVRGFGRARCLADMDIWGYSFREGSALAWLEGDGQDARAWLHEHGLIDTQSRPSWRLRGSTSLTAWSDSGRRRKRPWDRRLFSTP